MKKLALMFFAIFIYAGLGRAQTITSNGTGGGAWNSGSTWQGGVAPNSSNDVIIAGSDSVYTESGAECNSLTIFSGGIISTSVDTVYIVDALTVESEAVFYNNTTEPTLPGEFIFLDPASTVVHTGSGTVGGEGNLEFGNLIIQRIEGCVPGGNLLVMGDLIINNFAANVVFRGVRPVTGSQTHTVLGDVYINRGTLSCIDVGDIDMVGIWNFEGNVYVNDEGPTYFESRIGCFSSANALGLGIINIGGDLIINGGRLQAGTSSTPGLGTGIINIGGDLIMSSNSGIATNSIGPFAINFNGTGALQTVNLNRSFSMTTVVSDTINLGANVVFALDTAKWTLGAGGAFVIDGTLDLMGNTILDGSGSFILNPGGTLKTGNPGGITISDVSGSVQMTGGRTYSSEASYEFKGTGTQFLGDGLPNTVNGLAINNPDGIMLDKNLTINSSLNMLNGDLNLNGNTIVLGENANLIESAGNTVTGLSGMITTTKNIGSPSELNVGGLGAVLTTGNDLGTTIVERYHSPAAGNGNQGIARRYNISPGQNNTGLSAALRLYYDDTELNGLNETGLQIFKSADGLENSWDIAGGTVNAADNYVEINGVSDFSHWTIADVGQSLPVEEETKVTPDKFALHQNYPNPFNPETKIRFEIPSESFVNISIFNVIGEEIINLVNEKVSSGIYSVSFNGEKLPSGLYLYRLTAGNQVFTKKMMLLK